MHKKGTVYRFALFFFLIFTFFTFSYDDNYDYPYGARLEVMPTYNGDVAAAEKLLNEHDRGSHDDYFDRSGRGDSFGSSGYSGGSVVVPLRGKSTITFGSSTRTKSYTGSGKHALLLLALNTYPVNIVVGGAMLVKEVGKGILNLPTYIGKAADAITDTIEWLFYSDDEEEERERQEQERFERQARQEREHQEQLRQEKLRQAELECTRRVAEQKKREAHEAWRAALSTYPKKERLNGETLHEIESIKTVASQESEQVVGDWHEYFETMPDELLDFEEHTITVNTLDDAAQLPDVDSTKTEFFASRHVIEVPTQTMLHERGIDAKKYEIFSGTVVQQILHNQAIEIHTLNAQLITHVQHDEIARDVVNATIDMTDVGDEYNRKGSVQAAVRILNVCADIALGMKDGVLQSAQTTLNIVADPVGFMVNTVRGVKNLGVMLGKVIYYGASECVDLALCPTHDDRKEKIYKWKENTEWVYGIVKQKLSELSVRDISRMTTAFAADIVLQQRLFKGIDVLCRATQHYSIAKVVAYEKKVALVKELSRTYGPWMLEGSKKASKAKSKVPLRMAMESKPQLPKPRPEISLERFLKGENPVVAPKKANALDQYLKNKKSLRPVSMRRLPHIKMVQQAGKTIKNYKSLSTEQMRELARWPHAIVPRDMLPKPMIKYLQHMDKYQMREIEKVRVDVLKEIVNIVKKQNVPVTWKRMPKNFWLDLKHGLIGDHPNSKGTGYHIEWLFPEKVKKVIMGPGQKGTKLVQWGDPYFKDLNTSTLFPRDWHTKKVIDKTLESLQNPSKIKFYKNKLVVRGKTKCSMEVESHLTESGKIETYYPRILDKDGKKWVQ